MTFLASSLLAAISPLLTLRPPPSPEGTNCHRSCYTLDLKYALPMKKDLWAKCGFATEVVVQKAMRGE